MPAVSEFEAKQSGGADERHLVGWADVTLRDVDAAQARIMPHLHRTPLLTSAQLSDISGVRLGMKAEVFQKTGSFKARGALNAALLLNPDQRERGLVTLSAGNHGQGLAWAGARVGTKTVVFMPKTAVPAKVDAIRGYGAEPRFVENMERVLDDLVPYQREHGLTFVSPFADPAVIAGQGVVGLEILEDMPDVENIIVAAGGGGLLSGILVAVKSQRPDVRIVGVEPTGANIVRQSLDAGRPVSAERIETVADGLAAPFAAELSQAIIAHYVDDMIEVTDDDIIAAMKLILGRAKVLVEPSGAAALAGLLSGRTGAKPGSKTVVILSGGNIDPARLKGLL
jgi:threonine dehydratase